MTVRLKFNAAKFRKHVDGLRAAGKLTPDLELKADHAARALDMAKGPVSRRQNEIKLALTLVEEFERKVKGRG